MVSAHRHGPRRSAYRVRAHISAQARGQAETLPTRHDATCRTVGGEESLRIQVSTYAAGFRKYNQDAPRASRRHSIRYATTVVGPVSAALVHDQGRDRPSGKAIDSDDGGRRRPPNRPGARWERGVSARVKRPIAGHATHCHCEPTTDRYQRPPRLRESNAGVGLAREAGRACSAEDGRSAQV